MAGRPVYFYDFLGVRTASGDVENTGDQLLVDWRVDLINDPTPAGLEQYDLAFDPYELDSEHSLGGAIAQQRAAMSADIALLRDCGKAGRPSCVDAERSADHVFYGGFD